MTADEVERLVKIALDWLGGDRIEYRRLAAVLILKEMAENASTVFNVHVPEFVEAIWVALRDPKLNIPERAVEALRACLWVIEKRETRWRVQWYYRMFEATQDGLGRNAPIHCIHGSLLAVGELLRNTGEFMMSRYREVAEIVLRYLEHRDRLVRLSITSLLPRIAYFLRDRFVTNYLTTCMKHIFRVLKMPAEAASGFIALGEMAGALDGELINYLPTITSHLHDVITPRRGQPSMEALACVGNLAKAMGPFMEPHVRNLLDVMFSVGLSSTLVEALEHITASIPTLLPTIQVRLLDCISGVFARNQQVQSRPSNAITRTTSSAAMLQVSEHCSSALVQLALQTLARFNFKDRDLLEFARELVVPYLEDDDGGTRKDAALCCCKLMENSLFGILSVPLTSNRSTRSGGRRRRLIEEIVEKLLIAAVADADVAVRLSIFSSLHETGGFDDYLAQADCLTAVFAALNDEDFAVREIAISLAGRLSAKNPTYVLPALRRHLIQLLTYLKQRCLQRGKCEMLGCLIRNCERLILPYISPIQKALITKLNEGTGTSVNNGIITGVLVTVGDLTRVGGFAMRQYIPELMPLIVGALLDSAAAMKREVVVTTLGQVVQSRGYVITPYNEYPQLLGLLLKLLNGELAWSTRREVLKVLGIMGALDPHVHKRNQLTLPGSHGEVASAACDPSQHTRSSMDEVPVDLWPSFATSEDYYSTVAITCLMRIFRDSSLSSYHQKVVGSLTFIFKALNLGCVPYLPKVLPELLHTVRSCDDNNLKEYITWKLGTLVSIVRQHIRKYLPDLFSLISELWSSFNSPAANRPVHGSPVLHLLEQLFLALNDEFKTHLPFILPSCIQVLTDAERFKDYTYVVDILHTLEVFGGTLVDHMHLLLPALVRIFKLDASIEVRRVGSHICSCTSLEACLGRHKDFEEIEDRIRRRDPLILVTVAQEQTCQFPGEVISDPLNDTEDPESRVDPHKPHKVNEGRIRSAGEASQRSTREDWTEWMRHFSIELLKESPAPALRTCAKLAQLQPFIGRELFAVGFVSCWTELNESCRRQLVRSLEMAFSSPNIPPEILAILLNLAEFMEHDERPFPIDIRLLGALAEKCRAFAKALHYKEMEFEGACSNMMDGNPVAIVEALIHINNQLHQHEAAVGILTYSQQHLTSEVSSQHLILEATLGQMRCLAALARWEELNKLCKEYWAPAEPAARLEMAPMVWQALLSVRSLVLPPTEDVETWIKFASLCRKSGRISQARSSLTELLQFDPESTPETERYIGDPQVILAYLKYQWSLGEDHRRQEAFARLKDLGVDFSRMPGFEQSMQSGLMGTSSIPFAARVYLKLGTWQWALSPCLDDDSIQEILNALRNATHCATTWAKAWHNWALFNTAVMSHYTLRGYKLSDSDILRLLTLWFNHGATSEVQMALQRGFSLVNINTWLVVLPQIIARTHSNNLAVRTDTSTVGTNWQSHPQALMYPLLVACKYISTLRKEAAQEVVDQVRQHSGVLVDEAQLVSAELVRVAILSLEMWHEGLEETSRLYFGERNVEAMMTVLEPLHQMLEECAMRNNNTINERFFIQQYRQELLDAHASCIKYTRTKNWKRCRINSGIILSLISNAIFLSSAAGLYLCWVSWKRRAGAAVADEGFLFCASPPSEAYDASAEGGSPFDSLRSLDVDLEKRFES
ncbi:Serine/threonine-protein kinase TOR [Striga hermonthica]|uniref:Serine/threonine-protein kinase TOR n=1 Tax=Striga hermonthica TaxID=68872 RepID=A0A9N7NQL3_STRHE|nr:Serine/threonine-protein kinase TOR [Striga hermonthica]